MTAIRDPIHSWIKIDDDEKALIDSRIFQRLRHIKQTTTADLVYPGATQTRFSHSIGTMYVATLYTDVLKNLEGCGYSEKWAKTVRIAALLHDISHGPFSHAYDHYDYKDIYPWT